MSYLSQPDTSVRSWLLTRDHKRIGVMFLITTTAAMLLGGLFAELIRLQHLTPGNTIVGPEGYNRLFTLHGVVMVWLFMIPAIPSGFGNFLVPLMIGAKDVAFPRLNLLSFWVYVAGALVTLFGMLAGGADTGWTFYAPYSSVTSSAVSPVAAGIFILGCSTIMSGINFIVTIHTLRAPGITWFRMPLFIWGIYATSIIQVLATPVLGLTLLLILLDHGLALGIFDPARGGDPLLYQHLFWFYSHPAVYIMILPAMGVVSEVVCAFARKNPLSYRAIAYSSLGIAFVGFLTWGHHLFVAGESSLDAGAFGILSELVAVFSAIKTFTWVGTLYRGSIQISTPLVYIYIFLFLFIFGGMTGVAQATMSLDVHWHDSYFIVAHFHFIMVGGTMAALFAAAHYWFPKITGRLAYERWGVVCASLVMIGFIVTFVPQFLLGNAGMPRRYSSYPERFQTLHVISTVGSWVLGLGVVLDLGGLGFAGLRGRRSEPDPWGALSFEWRTSSPPPVENFSKELSVIIGPYDYHLPVESA